MRKIVLGLALLTAGFLSLGVLGNRQEAAEASHQMAAGIVIEPGGLSST